jgi:GGDEF domain-containing protein
MDETTQSCILHGYEDTKKIIDELDEDKITNIENIKVSFDEIDVVYAYYTREYEGTLPDARKNKNSFFKTVYSVIKTLMHLHYISIDNDRVKKIYNDDKRLPSGLRFANEIFCWNVLIHMYKIYIKDKNSQRQASMQDIKEWPPFCELHFEETIKSVVTTFFQSRDHLSDITPAYIELLFELLTQRHSNISAGLVGKLLNRHGFITYLTYWGQETAAVGLMYCDLDKFKQVNDNNSHLKGDEILRSVADVLSAICEKYHGIPARVGGEEFWLAFNFTTPGDNGNPTPGSIIEKELNDIFKELQQDLKRIDRPNPDPACVSRGEYKNYMTMSVAGGVVPMPKGYGKEEIGEWFDELDAGVRSVKETSRDDYKFVRLSLPNNKNTLWARSSEEE